MNRLTRNFIWGILQIIAGASWMAQCWLKYTEVGITHLTWMDWFMGISGIALSLTGLGRVSNTL